MVLKTRLEYETVLRFHLAPEWVPAMDVMTRLELERVTDSERWMELWMERWMIERWMERWMGRYLTRRWGH